MIAWLMILTMAKAHATETVLVAAPSAANLEYRAELKARGEITPSQYYRTHHPDSSQREQLLAAFADAQKAFLGDSMIEAKKKFTAVTDLVWTDDWERGDREIFLQSYLRLAQMENESSARDQWLRQSLLLGENVGLDASLYPPPLLERRKELAAKAPRKTVSSAALPPGWTDLLVNGQSCLSETCALYALGKVRVTYLSNRWLPHSEVVDVNEIEHLKIPAVAWVSGGCEQPLFAPEAMKFPSRRAFWSSDCEPVRLSSQRPANGKSLPSLDFTKTGAEGRTSTPFYRSKWFWIGAGVVTIAAAIASSQHHDSKDPTTTYGY